jgi:hypothetical protein
MKTMRISLTAVLMLGFGLLQAQQPEIQYFRPWDQNGINVFEPSKALEDQPEFDGFKLRIGGSFTQEFQALSHSNVDTTTDGSNTLYDLGPGFNLAMANLNFDIQLADGIRVSLENYMSARHHPEFWVKGGYIQIDKLPMFDNPEWFTKYLRVKIGHFQPNFGDMQFRPVSPAASSTGTCGPTTTTRTSRTTWSPPRRRASSSRPPTTRKSTTIPASA